LPQEEVMKKTNKLILRQETLRTLAGMELEAVAGGQIDIISINKPTCRGWGCTSQGRNSCEVNGC